MGHVFHPGHEALHGVTVVIAGTGGRHFVGRYHETTERGVVVHDAGAHSTGSAESVDAWIARQQKFGVKVEHRVLVVPRDEVERIVRLGEWKPSK